MPDDNHHTDDHKRSTPAENNRRESGKITTRHRPPKTGGRTLARVHYPVLKPRARAHTATPGKTQGPGGRDGLHDTRPRPGNPKARPMPPTPGNDPTGRDKPPSVPQPASGARPPTPKGRRHRRAMMKRKLHRKEVIQPHLPVRLPCYDLVPITSLTLDGSPHKGQATGFGCCRLS